MPSAKMTTKGQITVPVEVRLALGLEAGDRLLFEVRPDGVVEMRPQKVDLLSLFGSIRPSVQGVTLADMERAIGEGARRKNARD